MQLTITDLIPNPATPNSYEVVIETMVGDADGYENVLVGPFIKGKDELILEHLLATIKDISVAFPSGMCGEDTYNFVKNFDIWFGTSFYPTKEIYDEQAKTEVAYDEYVALEKFLQGFNDSPEWPHNQGTDNEYVSFTIYYYDENLNKYAVKVEA